MSSWPITRRGLTAAFYMLATLLAAPAWAEVPMCAACGKEIGVGRYLQDQWKANYHVQHQNVPRCYYCARGISQFNTGGGVRYAGGREVCNICQQTAVTDAAAAEAAMDRVRSRMAAWGLVFEYGEIPVRLVDQHTLNRLYGRSSMHDGRINGLTTKRWTKDETGKVLSREVNISMLHGLPLEVFEKTMAHELMHAWMFLDKQPEHAPQLEEGVCNLAAYYVLQESSTDLASFMREAMWKSKDPVYGQGLRRAITFVQRHEFSGLVKMLRANKDFPRGF